MWFDYVGPKRMYMTWSTAGTLQYGPDYWVSPIWSDLLQFGNLMTREPMLSIQL